MTLEQLRGDVAELLYVEPAEIADDDDLMSLGLDSVRVMSLTEKWRRGGVDVSFVDLAERFTLGSWWQLIEQRSR